MSPPETAVVPPHVYTGDGSIVEISAAPAAKFTQSPIRASATNLNEFPLINDTKNDVEKVPAGEPHGFPKFNDMRASRILLILLSLGLATFLFAIEQTIVATSIAAIGSALDVKGSLTWITTSYLLTITAIQPITGRLADAVGTRKLLVIEIWIFIVGNLVAGLSKNLTQLVAGRLISGAGGAGVLSLVAIVVSQLTSERQRGAYLNLINLVFTVADAIGPLVGGGFSKSGNWRWIFLFNAPFGPVITFILVKVLPSSPTQSVSFRTTLGRIDLAGMTAIMATLSFIVVGLNLGGQAYPWGSPIIIGMFCAAGVSFIAFVIAENYAKLPLAPMYLFTRWQWRNVPLIIVIRCLLFFHLFATTFYLPMFLQVVGTSAITSAALITPFLIMAAFSSTITNHLAYKTGHVRPIFLFAQAVLPVGMGLMSTLHETSSIGRVVGYSLICGFGFGCGTQISMVIAQVGLPADELPTVTALVSTAPGLGGVLGVGIIGTIINNTFRRTLSQALSSTSGLNLNDAVNLVLSLPPGDLRNRVISSYMQAWKAGYMVLAGIAAAQFVLSLCLRPVVFSDDSGNQAEDTKVG